MGDEVGHLQQAVGVGAAQSEAAVAGVSLEGITTWGEASRYVALDATVVTQELTERSTLLAQLNGLSLHDDE